MSFYEDIIMQMGEFAFLGQKKINHNILLNRGK